MSEAGILEFRDGWWVPAADRHALPVLLKEVADVKRILPHCEQKRIAVQAGGNVGIWPEMLSRSFKLVATFEPDIDNFEAIKANMQKAEGERGKGWKNVFSFRAALGDVFSSGAINRIDPANIGAHQVMAGEEFPVIALDNMHLTDIDLIQLDIEGYEHKAILGAIETIKSCSPVVCLELKGLGKQFGYSDEDTYRLMESLGYKVVEKMHRDVVFKK